MFYYYLFVFNILIYHLIGSQNESCTNPNSTKTSQSSQPLNSEFEIKNDQQNDAKKKQSIRNWGLIGGTIILAGTLYGVSIQIIIILFFNEFIRQIDSIILIKYIVNNIS